MSLPPDSPSSVVREPAEAPAYEVQSVRFRYPTATSLAADWALNGVTFEVKEGEVLGIVGPNGSGKTSLLKLLARIITPTEGSAWLFGAPLSAMTQKDIARVVAVVPQDTQQLFPFMVAESVLMGRFPHRAHDRWNSGFGWETQEDVAVAREAMVTMDITHLARRSMMDLSGGERQRVVIARALAQDPKVLLLDEPTAFLDLQHQIEICSVVRRLKEQRGLTIVLVSHDLNLVSQYCDRLILLDHGHVFRVGPPEEVIQSEVLKTVYQCHVLVDRHPLSGLPRVTLPGRALMCRP